MKSIKKINNILTALAEHEDQETALKTIEEIGTNTADDEIRELTAQVLIRKNTHSSLAPMILNRGKGINDLSAKVSMTAINELLSLSDKSEAIRILEDTMELHSDDDIRDTARSVRALIAYSN